LYIKEKVDSTDFSRLMRCGLLGVSTNQLLFFHGLNLTSPIDASIIITAVPIVAVVFGFILLKEKKH
jgi:drug/metabolite transporter (DMT)-like permease